MGTTTAAATGNANPVVTVVDGSPISVSVGVGEADAAGGKELRIPPAAGADATVELSRPGYGGEDRQEASPPVSDHGPAKGRRQGRGRTPLVAFRATVGSLGSAALPPPLPRIDALGPLSFAGVSHECGDYVVPNEGQPELARQLFAGAPSGVHIAVGTDRAVIGAILNPNATHLVVLDRDPFVVRFHRLNVALLKLAGNAAEYRALRLHPQRWSAFLDRAILSAEERALLADDAAVSWWRDKVVDAPNAQFLHDPAHRQQFFVDSNYLFDDSLFAKAHALAVTGRMQAYQADLTDRPRVQIVVDALQRADLTVGVIDLSNCWHPHYLGEEQLAKLVDTLAPRTAAATRLVFSTRRDAVSTFGSGTPPPFEHVLTNWTYLGVSAGSLEGQPYWASLFLAREMFRLFDEGVVGPNGLENALAGQPKLDTPVLVRSFQGKVANIDAVADAVLRWSFSPDLVYPFAKRLFDAGREDRRYYTIFPAALARALKSDNVDDVREKVAYVVRLDPLLLGSLLWTSGARPENLELVRAAMSAADLDPNG